MLAKRVPLLSAFAGGCLSGAVLLGLWHTDSGLAPPSAPRKRAVAHELSEAPATEARAEPADTSSPKGTGDTAAESPADAGSSVADVLSRLEASYRQGLAAERAPAAPQPTTTVTAPPPQEMPARQEPALALAETAAPLSSAPPAVAPQAAAPQATALQAPAPRAAAPPTAALQAPAPQAPSPSADTAPVVATRDDARPRDVYNGDVHQNVYNGATQSEVYQMQQLAVLQYMQLLALSSYTGLASPPRMPRGVAARRPAAFSSSLTNPDNPWGFDFPPTVLAK
jgi:hypothetical protein